MSLHPHIDKDGFRLRGLAFSRLDAFSDVVFGFAITLLVVSLEVPHTYAELHRLMLGFMPFGISFLFLMMVWYQHYKFFRRFALHDLSTVWINGALLFVLLFYVYPLKFLFTFVVAALMGQSGGSFANSGELRGLMTLYGVGFAMVYALLAALYLNGYRQRDSLELTPLERALTRGYITRLLLVAAVGILSCLVAWLLPAGDAGYAGLTFWLIVVVQRVHARLTRRKLAALRAAEHPPMVP